MEQVCITRFLHSQPALEPEPLSAVGEEVNFYSPKLMKSSRSVVALVTSLTVISALSTINAQVERVVPLN